MKKRQPQTRYLPQWVLPLSLCLVLLLGTIESARAAGDTTSPVATITCGTTKGDFEMTLYRYWSPHGYDRAVTLFHAGYYDNSHFFRVVPNFLVQFGISYSSDQELQTMSRTPIPDDEMPSPRIPFEIGTISFAGSGDDSRTSHLFIAYKAISQFGENEWETPVGKVTKGMEDVVAAFYSGYGDMPPWGKGPEQQPIYDGPKYIEENFPLLDKFTTCTVEISTIVIDDEDPYAFASRSSDSSDTEDSDDTSDSGEETGSDEEEEVEEEEL